MKIFDIEKAEITASELLKIGAVKLSPENPFTWASGIKSPIYCDNRKILSFPETRNFIKTALAQMIAQKYPDADVIAGVATGAIASGALVADILGKPFIYIRSEPKKHGLTNRIEGVLEKGQKVVVIEDLISTGGSSLNAVEAVRETGNDVLGMCAIFTYDLPAAHKNFKEADCELTVLTNFRTLADFASKNNYIQEKDIEGLLKWQASFGA